MAKNAKEIEMTTTGTKMTTDLVHSTVMRSMFNHLTKTFTATQAREILVQKYPNSKSEINKMEIEMEDTNTTTETIASAIAAAKTTKAAKTKTAKAPKAAKAKRVTKMDQARELYKAESDKSRKNMIAVFSAKLGLSPAAASTYFYTVKA